ncbi:MAG: Rieske 2Fe-2S domain-containing protein [Acidobacteria bacterium]|nr:Rieske 2Fe-2S domain-containing protein [Acidobacteriota bacterium]
MSESSTTLPAAPLDEPSTRRTLLRVGLGAAAAGYGAALAYPVYRYLATPVERAAEAGAVTQISIPKTDEPPAGSALMLQFGARPAMLIHHADGSLVCFDAVCTHLGCTVQFEPDQKRIFCACHSGVYDMRTGQVVGGPPPRSLGVYHVEATDGDIIISRV